MGQLILGYGELDLSFCLMAGSVLDQKYAVLNAVNQTRSETSRINVADALVRGPLFDLGFEDAYRRIYQAMIFCLRVRNQFAHCQWGDLGKLGLAFVKMDEATFVDPTKPTQWLSITLPFLQKHEAFFAYTRLSVLALEDHAVAASYEKKSAYPFPKEMHQPSMHKQWSRPALRQLGLARS